MIEVCRDVSKYYEIVMDYMGMSFCNPLLFSQTCFLLRRASSESYLLGEWYSWYYQRFKYISIMSGLFERTLW